MSATGIARRRPMPRDFPRSSAGLGFLWLRARAELGRAPGGCGIVQRAAWLGFVRHPGAAGSCSVRPGPGGSGTRSPDGALVLHPAGARVRSVAGDELPRGTLRIGAAAQPQALAPRPAPPPGRRTQRHPRPAALRVSGRAGRASRHSARSVPCAPGSSPGAIWRRSSAGLRRGHCSWGRRRGADTPHGAKSFDLSWGRRAMAGRGSQAPEKPQLNRI